MRTIASPFAIRVGQCAVALAGLAASLPTCAAVIFHATPIAIPNTVDGIYINLLTGATATSPAAVPGWDFNPWSTSGVLTFFWNGTPVGTSGGVAATAAGPYIDIPAGAVIGVASTFSSSSAPAQTIAFQSLGNHVLGFRFFNESTAVINYGMMGLSTSSPSGFPAVINWWAFENTGGAITIVPEAPSAALLSVGAAVLGAVSLRRQRRQRQAS